MDGLNNPWSNVNLNRIPCFASTNFKIVCTHRHKKNYEYFCHLLPLLIDAFIIERTFKTLLVDNFQWCGAFVEQIEVGIRLHEWFRGMAFPNIISYHHTIATQRVPWQSLKQYSQLEVMFKTLLTKWFWHLTFLF